MLEQKEIIETLLQFFTFKLSFEALIRMFPERENEIYVLLQGFQKPWGFVYTSIIN